MSVESESEEPEGGPGVDKPAFEELYRQFLRRIYGYARAHVGSAAEAEDVTSQVFINAYQAYDRLQARGQMAAWLFTIARNACLDHHRRARTAERAVRALGSEPSPLADPADLAEDRIQNRRLLAVVARLPDRQREVITLRHAGDLSFKEIGEMMGRSEEAAKMLYHRALKALRGMAAELR